MRYRIHWSNGARTEFRSIISHLMQFDPEAAARIAAKLMASAQSLETFPHRGTPIGGGMRQMSTVYPYIIRYCIEGDRVEIARVYHGARRVQSQRLEWKPEMPLAAVTLASRGNKAYHPAT